MVFNSSGAYSANVPICYLTIKFPLTALSSVIRQLKLHFHSGGKKWIVMSAGGLMLDLVSYLLFGGVRSRKDQATY